MKFNYESDYYEANAFFTKIEEYQIKLCHSLSIDLLRTRESLLKVSPVYFCFDIFSFEFHYTLFKTKRKYSHCLFFATNKGTFLRLKTAIGAV